MLNRKPRLAGKTSEQFSQRLAKRYRFGEWTERGALQKAQNVKSQRMMMNFAMKEAVARVLPSEKQEKGFELAKELSKKITDNCFHEQLFQVDDLKITPDLIELAKQIGRTELVQLGKKLYREATRIGHDLTEDRMSGKPENFEERHILMKGNGNAMTAIQKLYKYMDETQCW